MATRLQIRNQIKQLESQLPFAIDNCPFCGTDSVVIHPNALATVGCEMGIPGTDVFYAHCDQCGAEGPQGDSEAEAIEIWNRRA